MTISITSRFAFALPRLTDVLLQFEAAIIPEQLLLNSNTQMTTADHFARISAQDGIGERIWIRAEGNYEVSYKAQVDVRRILTDIGQLERVQPHMLPGGAVQYLFDSLYCPASRFQPFVASEFGGLDGGKLILALRDWVAERFAYAPGTSTPQTNALDTFVERRGICRDFAHVMIALARAAAIPARFVSVFAPGVKPQDFHAIAEVFLDDPAMPGGGAWHIVDATGMADPASTVKIGVGRDAADVSFMTTFGEVEMGELEVSVTQSG